MSKSFLVWLLATLLLATALSAQAQRVKKVYRIGYLSGVDRATDAPRAEGIRRALRERGYVEGQNLAIEYRHGGENRTDRSELVAELIRLNVDLIVIAGGDPLILAAKQATKTISIVMAGQGSDPVRAGFVDSLARPGGNLTGITNISQELGGKRLELLKEVVPKATRVAVLYDPDAPGAVREVKEDLSAPARALKLTIRPIEIRSSKDLDNVFTAISKERPHGLYATGGGSAMRSNLKRIADFALTGRLPSMHNYLEGVEAGGLMMYAADREDAYRRTAYFVDRILNGAKPADLPVEQPMKFTLIINLKTANQIGLTIPQWTLMKADRVIR